MREIKFRAWDKNKKSYLAQQNLLDDVCRFHREDGSYSDVSLLKFILVLPQQNSFILEQFTGLKDKNGKEIYEGDIVKNEFDRFGEVFFDIQNAKWCIKATNPLNSFTEMTLVGLMRSGKVEIIGNIHKNQELLDSLVKNG